MEILGSRPFQTGVTVPTIMDIPSGCVCTWVPKGNVFALKFAHRDCVHVYGEKEYRPFKENRSLPIREKSDADNGNVPDGMRESYPYRGTAADISPKSVQGKA